MFENVNYLAVFVSALAGFMLGWYWYSPSLFGDIWIKEAGFTPEKIAEGQKKGMAGMSKQFAVSFLGGFVMVCTLALLMSRLGIDSWMGGVKLALLVWAGFVAAVQVNDVLFGGKTQKLYLINIGYYLVSLLIAGVILGVWQ